METVYGKAIADEITEGVKAAAENLKMFGERPAKLAIVRVGDRPGDVSYEKGAAKRMEKCGILCEMHDFPETVDESEFLREFGYINVDRSVDGILVLRPLPRSLEEKTVELLDAGKDVDCMKPDNLGRLISTRKRLFAPCTALAVEKTIRYIMKEKGESLKGKKVTIIGRSAVVGRPLGLLLLSDDATVTVCHTKTRNLADECRNADIIVAAAGHAGLVGRDFVKPDAVVIDVGVNLGADGKLTGDVKADELSDIPGTLTPVPGGVGAVTTSVLASQVMRARLVYN